MAFAPILYRVAPEAPKLRSTRRDLEPVMANEEEVVRVLRQPAKVSIRNNVPSEDVPKDLGWEESRNVQQRVSGAFEMDYGLLVFFDLLIQRSYGIEVDLPVHRYYETTSGAAECIRVPVTHINGDVSPRGDEILSWVTWMKAAASRLRRPSHHRGSESDHLLGKLLVPRSMRWIHWIRSACYV